MRQHVVGDDQVGLTPLLREVQGRLLTEELHQSGHADLFRRRRDRIGRIDAQNGYAHLQEILQQVPIVAG